MSTEPETGIAMTVVLALIVPRTDQIEDVRAEIGDWLDSAPVPYRVDSWDVQHG